MSNSMKKLLASQVRPSVSFATDFIIHENAQFRIDIHIKPGDEDPDQAEIEVSLSCNQGKPANSVIASLLKMAVETLEERAALMEKQAELECEKRGLQLLDYDDLD